MTTPNDGGPSLLARLRKSFWVTRALDAEAECEKLQKALSDEMFRETYIKGCIDGSLGLSGDMVKTFASIVAGIFLENGIENYLQITVTHQKTGDEFVLSLQKVGRMTPHEFRLQAERERDEARAELAMLRARGESPKQEAPE